MKKSMNLLAKIGLACCLAGLVLCLAGWISGADIGDVINSDTLDPDYDPNYIDEDGFWDWSDFDFDDSNTIETTAEEKVMGLEHFNNIKAQLEVTELFLEDGEEYGLSIMEGAGRSFTYKVENDTLILKENSKDKHLNNTSSRVVITIPKDTHLHQVEIEQGVGNVVIYDLSAHELNINSGVGNTDLKRIDVDELSIDGGVGNIEGDDLSVTTELDLNSGVGTVSLHGDFCGEIDLDSGMGNVELFFERPQSNYLIDIENGFGTVKINGEKYKSGEYHQGNAVAEHKIDIENGTGNMELTFEE